MSKYFTVGESSQKCRGMTHTNHTDSIIVTDNVNILIFMTLGGEKNQEKEG